MGIGMIIGIAVALFIFYKLVLQSIYPPGNRDNEATAQGCIIVIVIIIGVAIAIFS